MSIVEEFNYVDSTKSEKIEKEIEVDVKKRKLSDEMEISSSDDDDNESLADSPVDGIERYKLDFQNVIEGVFGEKSSQGSNHTEFVEQVKTLISTVEFDHVEQIYTHVICNQYAKAVGIKNGKAWEKLDNMWELYKSGKLLRFKYRWRKLKKSKYNFKKTKIVDTSSEEEEEEDEKGFYAFQILEKHKLLHFSNLESILDKKASSSGEHTKSIKRKGMHIFQNEDLLESFLPEASLEFLKSNSTLCEISKNKSFENVPQEITSYTKYGEKEEGDQSEDRVRWIDDVFEDDLEFNIEGHPNCERILLKLEAQNSNRAVKQIAMKCGSLFIQRYKRQPLEKDEEGRNIYRNCHLSAMKDIYNKVKSQYIK